MIENITIMVRTRGLRRALNRVLGQALGREVGGDEEQAPERQRPTASVRRQRAAAAIVENTNEPMHDDAVDEAHEEHMEDVPADSEGFPGGPHDISVLISYADHVAAKVWAGEERPELKLASHGRKVEKIGRPPPEVEVLLANTGLTSLITCSLETGDRGLLSAFVERWHKETSSFHLPIGEFSITLDDVASLLHLPIIGAFHTYDALDVKEAVDMLVDLVGVSFQEALEETQQCRGPSVRLA